MFDKLLDFVIAQVHELFPIVVVKPFEAGVMLRWGAKLKELNSSKVYFKIPYIDEAIKINIATTTLSIPEQSIHSKDEKAIVVRAVVKYSIDDAAVAILTVYDPIDAISDSAQMLIKEIVSKKTWKEMCDGEVDNELTKKLRSKIKRWGIAVEEVTLTDLTVARSYRLFTQTNFIP